MKRTMYHGQFFLQPSDAALWARIAQNVKKPTLTVNVIDFDFFGINVSIWVPWSPLGPKKSWYLGRIIQIHIRFLAKFYVFYLSTLFSLFITQRARNISHFSSTQTKNRRKTADTSGLLGDKQQETVGQEKNIKFSQESELNFIYFLVQPFFVV